MNQLEKINLMWIVLENHKEFIKNNKIISKSQQRFRRPNNVFIKIKEIQSINLTGTYAYGTNKEVIHKIN